MDLGGAAGGDGAPATTARKVAAVSWTGGKDCNLALLRSVAAADGDALDVRALVCFHPPGVARFRAHPIWLQQRQAAALGLPLVMKEVDASQHEGSYADAYAACVRSLARDLGVQVLVTGDIDLVGSSTTNFITDVCDACRAGGVDMRAWLPLWQQDRAALLDEMLRAGLDIRFSCVKSPHFSAAWVGRRLDADAVAEMAKRGAAGLDLTGENGEYHTMVVGGPHFATPALTDLDGVEAQELLDMKGQNEGERWWALKPPTVLPTALPSPPSA